MIKKAVVLAGRVINIGDWDEQIATELEEQEDGIQIERQIVHNPMPPGAVVGDFDVRETADGQFVLASDYQALRAAEYPSVGDQLDALWKGGNAADEMRAKVMAVKAKYPKP